MAMTLPRHQFYTETGTRIAITTNNATFKVSLTDALTRTHNHQIPMNQVMRKYLISSRLRQAHFFAQVMLETAQWRNVNAMRQLMHEWLFGQYSSQNPMTQYYSAFYGRGIMQLTWAGNYRDYGNYRLLPNNSGAYIERLTPTHPRITATSTHWTGDPTGSGSVQIVWAPRFDPDIIATVPYNACDSGGFYWVYKHHSGVININRVCDQDFTPVTVGKINKLVNGGGNGYHERQAYAAYNMRILSDDTNTETEVQITTPHNPVRVNFLRPI
jgi:predicted chitinase